MQNIIAKRLLVCVVLILSAISWAAEPDKKGTLIGRLLDANQIPVEYAEVDLLKDGELVTGGISGEDGSFAISDIEYGTYTLQIRAIGYTTYTQTVTIQDGQLDLGTLTLKEDVIELNEARVEVTAVRQEIDKRIIEVGKDLVGSGPTAVEVLDKVPSLQVDQQSGDLSLRGNTNVRVFIDGKPSNVPTSQLLRQLPSDAIKQVEIITNPSAKYDPEGNSGIINIVTYKNKRKGYNVSTNLGYTYGRRSRYNGGINANINTGKVNLFGSYNTNFGENLFLGEVNNLTTDRGQQLNLLSDNFSQLVKVGFDYFINDKTALTVYTTQNFFDGDNTNQTTLRVANNFFDDSSKSISDNRNQDYSLNFKRDFEKEGHFLELDGFLSLGDNEDDAAFLWESAGIAANGDDLRSFNQRTLEDRNNVRINLDYTLPVWKKGKIETGVQYRMEGIENDFATTQLLPNAAGTDGLEAQDTFFDYDRNIYSTYLNFGYQWEKFGMQLGARFENVQEDADTRTVATADFAAESVPFDNDYTQVYPSAFFTYNLAERTQISLNYSRRVDRPGIWQVSPIRRWQTALVRNIGNPDLQPQFTDNYELGFLRRFQKGKGSINASIFYRDITDEITRFLRIDDENEAGNTTLLSFDNIDQNEAYGFEISGFYKPTKWWSFNASFDIFGTQLVGPNPESDDFIFVDATIYNARMSNDFELSKTWNAQLFTMFRGPNRFLQGEMQSMYRLDFGLRKSFADGKGTVNFRVNDITNTFFARANLDNPFQQRGEFNWESQTVFVGLSYNFGGKVKTRSDKQNNSSGQNGGGGIGF